MTELIVDLGLFALSAALSHWVGPAVIRRSVRGYADDLAADDRGLPAAGKLIGRLERFLILLFVYSDTLTGVGFLLTAKSVFRFGDAKDDETHRRTEYYLIGSLASFTLAIVLGFAARLADRLIEF